MNEILTDCTILKKGYFKEYDVWLRAISPAYGLMTLFAFGGAKSKRRFTGCLDVFNTISCRITFRSNKNYYVLQEASLVAHPGILRKDWHKMGIAYNCISFINALEIDSESGKDISEFLDNMRRALQYCKSVSSLFALYCRFRLACILGYAPTLHVCGKCGRLPGSGDVYFAYDEGKIYCRHCQKHLMSAKKIRLPLKGLHILLMIKNFLPSQWPEEEEDMELRRAIAQAMDCFVQFHIGLEYKNGYFRHV